MSEEKVQVQCGSVPGQRGCDGSGLYRGFAEKEGEAVICLYCKGTGGVEVDPKLALACDPYIGRKHKDGVRTVSRSRGAFVAFGIGATGPRMTYEEFLKAIPASEAEASS